MGNEGVKRLLASLPFTCLPSAALCKALPPTPPLSQETTLIVCISLSNPLSLLLPVLFFHFPHHLSFRPLFFYPPNNPTCVCQSHSFSLLSAKQWSMGGDVHSEDNRRGAHSREMQGTETWEQTDWGSGTESRALDCNKKTTKNMPS